MDPNIGCGTDKVFVDTGDDTNIVFPPACAKTDNFKVREMGNGGGDPTLIKGTKYYDLNLNQMFDGGEAVVEGFRIDLEILDSNFDPTGVVLTDSTDVMGMWGFFIEEGTNYRACEVLPLRRVYGSKRDRSPGRRQSIRPLRPIMTGAGSARSG